MADKNSIVELLKGKVIPNLGITLEDVAQELITHVSEKKSLDEAIDYAKAFSQYRKEMFPDYADVRDYVNKVADKKWTVVDMESAIYVLDSGRVIEGGSPKTRFEKDPDDYYEYIVTTGGKSTVVDKDRLFCELLKFAEKSGNPLQYLVE